MITVYVAGPMSKGNLLTHVRHAIWVGDQIIEAGGVPYLPQVSILWELISPKAYEHWMKMDFEWVSRCDWLYRIPGESEGADREVEHKQYLRSHDGLMSGLGARNHRVFFDLDELVRELYGARR